MLLTVPNQFAGIWTRPMEKMATELWATRMRAKDIAERINVTYGTSITKNAVIGKMRRMNAPEHPRSYPKQASLRRPGKATERDRTPAKVRDQRKGELPSLPGFMPFSPGVPLFRRKANQCAWIEGETAGPDSVCCGAPVFKTSLCSYHWAMGWRAVPPRVRR